MKTLGRILLILAVFVLLMGITYVAVNANGSSSTTPTFERGEGTIVSNGIQPQLPEAGRPDFDRDGPAGGGWMFGVIRNLGALAVVVTLVVVPKRLLRRKIISIPAR